MGRDMASYDEIYDIIVMNRYTTEGVVEDLLAKHGVKDFKKRYDFKPLNDKNPNKGYCVIDGHKVLVDLDIEDPTIKTPFAHVPRTTSANIISKEPHIIVDKTSMSVIGKKKRDAIILHELSHATQDNRKTNAKGVDRRYADISNEEIVNKLVKRGCNEKQAIMVLKILRMYPKRVGDDKLIDELADYLKKYNNTDNEHLSSLEVKADRYAANRTSERALQKGVRDMILKSRGRDTIARNTAATKISKMQNDRKQRKEYNKLSDEDKREMYKKLMNETKKSLKSSPRNKFKDQYDQQDEDYNARMRALKDPYLRDAKPLKPGY